MRPGLKKPVVVGPKIVIITHTELDYLASSAGYALALGLGINHQKHAEQNCDSCPPKRKQSNALIAIARSIAHSISQ